MRRDSLRAKEAFVEALLGLCDEIPLERITASQVIERSGLARQTFYNHFCDLDELVSYVPVLFYTKGGLDPLSDEGVSAAFRYVLEHKAFFCRLVHHQTQNSFRKSYTRWLRDTLYARTFAPGDEDDPDLRGRILALDLYAYGCVDLFLAWCAQGLAWSPEQVLWAMNEAKPAFMREVGLSK